VREQLFRRLGDELPYATAVQISQFKNEDGVYHVGADIWVEKSSHKAMVIGKKGEALKQIGSAARKNCEKLLDSKVFMELWVKVRSGWSDNARDLYSLGYDEDQ
jgi:GTP-binding protein Era